MSQKTVNEMITKKHGDIRAQAAAEERVRIAVEAQAEALKGVAAEFDLPVGQAAEWLGNDVAPEAAREEAQQMQAAEHRRIWDRFNRRAPAADEAPEGGNA